MSDCFDAEANIAGGTEYLQFLWDQYNQDPLLALAGYNAVENAVISRSAVANFAETRDYVPKVIEAWSVAKTLCATTPVATTDPCVFDLDYTMAASVAARSSSSLTPSANSTIFSPPSTTSKTPRLVIIRCTTPLPVRGRVQDFKTLLSPFLLV